MTEVVGEGFGRPPPGTELLLAIGDGLATSNDAIGWVQRTEDAYDAGCFSFDRKEFAVIGTNYAASSRDGGLTWTPSPIDDTCFWRRIIRADELGLYVACGVKGFSGCISTSPDMRAWSAPLFTPGAYWYALAWNGRALCVVGDDNTGAPLAKVSTSPTGAVWTPRALPVVGINLGGLVSVAAAPSGRFAAFRIGGNADPHDGAFHAVLISDDDGATWSVIATPLLHAVGNVYKLICADGFFVGAGTGNGGGYNVPWSRGGSVWEYMQLPPGDGSVGLHSVCRSLRLGKYIGVRHQVAPFHVLTSDDARTWNVVSATPFRCKDIVVARLQ